MLVEAGVGHELLEAPVLALKFPKVLGLVQANPPPYSFCQL